MVLIVPENPTQENIFSSHSFFEEPQFRDSLREHTGHYVDERIQGESSIDCLDITDYKILYEIFQLLSLTMSDENLQFIISSIISCAQQITCFFSFYKMRKFNTSG